MDERALLRLARAPARAAGIFTLLSCLLVLAAGLTGHPVLLTLLAVCVPLALTAAMQATAVAPMASELLRLRQQVGRSDV